MTRIPTVLFLLFAGINIFFASWYVMHNDIRFFSDIARDFLLLKELDQKKIVFIGPHASGRLFHGPLWMYVNYPGYLLGHGNPVIVGWCWIFLIVLFLISGYFVAKELFDVFAAQLFVLMSSLYLVYDSNALFNPHGAMFLLPLWFLFFIRYIKTLSVKYLIVHVLLTGCLIQLQIAIGFPMLVLSFLYCIPLLFKKKKLNHLAAFLSIFIPLSTYIIFDVRHNFLFLHSAFLHGQTHDSKQTIISLITNRLSVFLWGIEFLRYGIANGSTYVFFIFIAGF